MKLTKLLMYTLGLVFIPNLLYHLDFFSSLSYGLIIICLLIIFMNGKRNINIQGLNIEKIFLYTAIILVINLPSILIFNNLNLKYIYSIFGILIIITGSILYTINLQKSKENIVNLIILTTYIITLLSIAERLGIFQFKTDIKSIFPFNEPSHYALSLSPFILSLMFINVHSIFKIIPLAINFYIVILIQNLTLMVVLTICTLVLMCKNRKLIIVIGLIIPLFLLNDDYFSPFIDYIKHRIDFSSDSNNTSALVYMQGYHLIYEVLEKTYGIGLGFNGLGEFIPNNDYSNKLYLLHGEYPNINDGGILISKLICEFGWIGVILIISYLYILIGKILKFKSGSFAPIQATAFGFLLSGFIDLFIRSTGYFTPSVFLFMVGIFLIMSKKNENNSKY